MNPTIRDLLVIGLVAGAPLALTLIVALVRGYRIDLHLERPRKGDRDA